MSIQFKFTCAAERFPLDWSANLEKKVCFDNKDVHIRDAILANA